MLLNFYKRLELKGGEVIWLVNSTRNFLKNFKSNVPKGTTVLYEYKDQPVDIIIYWMEKSDSPEEIIGQYIDKTKEAIWLVTKKSTEGLAKSHILNMAQNKISDFTIGEVGVRYVKK